MHYQKVTGSGPTSGWISTQLKGTDLLQPLAAPLAPDGAARPRGGVRVDHGRSPRAAEASAQPGAVCCLVGELPVLGGWDPKRAVKFSKKTVEKGATVWTGTFEGVKVPPGQPFKCCILHEASNTYVWEEAGPMHSWPASDEIQEFEAGVPAHTAPGHGAPGVWPPKVTLPKVEAAARTLGEGIDQWIPWKPPASCGAVEAPRTIFHAFHWPFKLVLERLKDIADMGFDAVQISPAQKSKHGHEWWARYQPQEMMGKRDPAELKELCRRADELKLRVIGDVVFNHMLVVGSCHEWRQAQANPARLKQLQERLVRETSMRLEDFQWPWFEMTLGLSGTKCGGNW
eukprot:g27285.t1